MSVGFHGLCANAIKSLMLVFVCCGALFDASVMYSIERQEREEGTKEVRREILVRGMGDGLMVLLLFSQSVSGLSMVAAEDR